MAAFRLRALPALLALLAVAPPCVAQTPHPLQPYVWRGAYAALGPSVVLFPERSRDQLAEQGSIRVGYVHPISRSMGGLVALEIQEFAVDREAFARHLLFPPTDYRGGRSRMHSAILGVEIAGAPVVGAASTYLQGGLSVVYLEDEPFEYFRDGRWYVRPGSAVVRPGGVLGGGVRLALLRGLHGIAEGGYTMSLNERGFESSMHLFSIRAGLAYRI